MSGQKKLAALDRFKSKSRFGIFGGFESVRSSDFEENVRFEKVRTTVFPDFF